ncbi:lipoprotein [Mesoplasma seiffertii]|uniref:lipoprotein n=1 Tax=Mesoplasma seiffertii TaxID=28224 RepID=UPI0004790DE3|nr:lipoprotein [Mesoplasma seiffertii]
MRKLLSILAAIGITTGAATTVIACKSQTSDNSDILAAISDLTIGVDQQQTILIQTTSGNPLLGDLTVSSSASEIVSVKTSSANNAEISLVGLAVGKATITVATSEQNKIEFNVEVLKVAIPIIQPIKDQKIFADDKGNQSVTFTLNITKPANDKSTLEIKSEPPKYGENVYPQKDAVTTAEISGDQVTLHWNQASGLGQDKVTVSFGQAKPVTFKASVLNRNQPIANPPGKGKSAYWDWKEANPNREKNDVIPQVAKNPNTYFSPYIDAALYQGDQVKEIIQQNKNFDHLTLAFAAQDANQKDKLDISFAGIDKSTNAEWEAYWWYLNRKLVPDILQPLVDAGFFKNTKVSYGGYNACMEAETYLPWVIANKLAKNNAQAAQNMLETALIGFQKEIADLVKQPMTKAIDFDIEGHAQGDEYNEDTRLLARTLAGMVKKDKEWDFSLTVAVLPEGLVEGPDKGYQVVDAFIEEYKKAGVDIKNLPTINPMVMDYGNHIYQEAIDDGLTNADLAIAAMESTKVQMVNSIKKHYGVELSDKDAYQMMGVTPMSGVNDTEVGVFTLEDAKEIYNWGHKVGISYISMWSINDDRGLSSAVYIDPDSYPEGVLGGQAGNKSQTTHGLLYLNEYDFTKAYTGDWVALK